ncbi:hypothetical protein K492DRAFT_233501 [Lichtheimia hyalospora FSU 10163]|nr:hypothetical protein K492DRAFT_233501 [Lichtheimia hyalospora FSU 10163]
MGRSLRSHTKKRYRAIKREEVFKPVEDARLARLAEAQAKAALKSKVGDYMDDEAAGQEKKAKEQSKDMMDTDTKSDTAPSYRQLKRAAEKKKAIRKKVPGKSKKKGTVF